MDTFQERTYGTVQVGKGRRPAVVVVDYQIAFTDPVYPLGGAPLIERGVRNTARLLEAARRAGAPVACCHTAYLDERETPHWKAAAVGEQFRNDHPGSRLDPHIYDERYDLAVRKTDPSILAQGQPPRHRTPLRRHHGLRCGNRAPGGVPPPQRLTLCAGNRQAFLQA